jgi:hypothetical protein
MKWAMKWNGALAIGVCLTISMVRTEIVSGQGGFELNSARFENQEAFVKQGRRCATHTLSEAQRRSVDRRVRRFAEANRQVLRTRTDPVAIRVLFHVIHDGNHGRVGEDRLDQQIAVLNDAFTAHGIRFAKAGVDYTDNANWFAMEIDTQAEFDAKTALGKETDRMLNFYTTSPPEGTLGWARFPWKLATVPKIDGIVILHSALPGGDAAPFHLGDTAVHEVGHWLGLFHTFGESPFDPCIDTDQLADTPAHKVNYGRPPEHTDSCPNKPGNDPVHNFMNYVDDGHMDRFTKQQATRIADQIALFRPLLLGETFRGRLRFDGY